jgi:hypothetical protein
VLLKRGSKIEFNNWAKMLQEPQNTKIIQVYPNRIFYILIVVLLSVVLVCASVVIYSLKYIKPLHLAHKTWAITYHWGN